MNEKEGSVPDFEGIIVQAEEKVTIMKWFTTMLTEINEQIEKHQKTN